MPGDATPVQLELLGGFRATVGGRPVPDEAWSRQRPRELVQLLALAEGYSVSRDAVIDALWPRLDMAAGAANLHKAAHHARRILGAREALMLTDGRVRLFPTGDVDVDVVRFESTATDALRRRNPDACRRATRLYAGDLLPGGGDSPWIVDRRQHLRRLFGDLLRGAERWEELATFEPCDEQAQRELMRASLEAGDPEAAVRVFRRLHESLTEAGLRPGLGARALYDQALAATDEARPPAHRGGLFGREPQVAAARKVLRLAGSGTGSTLLIDGPLGVGKSRLALAVADEVGEAGWPVAYSTATHADARVPYAALADAVGSLLASRPDLPHLLPPHVREAVRALTEAQRGADYEPPQLLQSLMQLLVVAAGGGAALLLVDDAHVADEATLELVQHLCNAIRFQPVVVLLAFRTHEAPPALTQLREDLVGRGVGTRLALAALDGAATAALARAHAPHALSDDSVGAIWNLTRGNPLFTQELASSVGADGVIDHSVELPDIVALRIAGLPAALRAALERAAIADTAIDAREFAALAAVDDTEAGSLLRAAVDLGLLTRDGQRYRFPHGLVRQVLARSVLPHERAAIHAEATERLIATGAAPARIAHHAGLAKHPEAARWYVEASRAAIVAGAFTNAHELTTQGLQAAGRPDPELLELRGDALLGLGDARAAATYRQALENAERSRRSPLLIKQARAAIAEGAIDTAERILAGTGDVEDDEQVQLLIVRALIAWYRNDVGAAAGLAEAAREAALTGKGATEEIGSVLALQVLAAHSAARWRLASVCQWMELYGPPGPGSLAIDAHLCVADYLLSGDKPAKEVIAFASRMMDAMTRSGSLRGQAFANVVLGQATLAAGDFDAAEAHLHESIDLHRRVGSVAGEVIALERLAERAMLQEHPEQAERLLEQALEVAPASVMYPHLLARVHAARIRNRSGDAAVAAVERAEDDMADKELCAMCSSAFHLAAGTAYARAGASADAVRHLDEVERLGPIGQSGLLGAQLTAARAEVALAEGDSTMARRLLVDAAAWLEQLGHRPAAAHCRRVLEPRRGG